MSIYEQVSVNIPIDVAISRFQDARHAKKSRNMYICPKYWC